MGSKLSPGLANIFCDMFEKTIISSEIEKGNILEHCRYADDCLLLIKKGHTNTILEKLNNFDPFLKFTSEIMLENKINFLDTTIINQNRRIHLEQYRKPESSGVVLNYKSAVAPLSYKRSTLIGELHRANNTTTTPEARKKAIYETREIFLKNGYPLYLIDEKMTELINRNFAPSENKAKRLADSENPDLHFYTMSLPYSSFRCSKIASKIYKILRQYSPNFRV